MTTVFDPIELAGVRLANRVAMAPMTRSRAYGPGASPTSATATYYAQRAGAGLILTEGTHANGYLLHQFLSTNANQRTDRWGGSVDNRIRLTVEVTRTVADAIGAHRVGLRISPANPYNDIAEDGHRDTYRALVESIDPFGLAYLHIGEGPDRELTLQLRKQWGGTLILNPFTPGRFTGPEDLALVEDGTADILSFGALFLANPDLPARLATGSPFNTPDPATFYGGDHRGYTDYPTLAR